MTSTETSDSRKVRPRSWRIIYLGILVLTVIVYLLLWVFSQAFT
jgi:hypothetical protein